MPRHHCLAAWPAGLAAVIFAAPVLAAGMACADLVTLDLPDTVIRSAT